LSSSKISVITATFNALPWLRRAIHSMLAQTCGDWEMLICPDDGEDYDWIRQIDSRIHVVGTSHHHTGAGAARNRGLAAASGSCVAVLDDDDTLAPNFVDVALRTAETSEFFTVPTCYLTEDGSMVRMVGAQHAEIDIPRFAGELGSLHAVGRRERYLPWRTCFAQDVLHMCETIDRAGGAIPVARETYYACTLRSASACAVRRDIDEEYGKLTEMSHGEMSQPGAAQTRALFQHRRDVNARFESRLDRSKGYHEFVRDMSAASGGADCRVGLAN
jgi:glycosyltransferase involved in cell wall biosynthesis